LIKANGFLLSHLVAVIPRKHCGTSTSLQQSSLYRLNNDCVLRIGNGGRSLKAPFDRTRTVESFHQRWQAEKENLPLSTEAIARREAHTTTIPLGRKVKPA
jgi:hypothetical protein